jgi:hypothetical protein
MYDSSPQEYRVAEVCISFKRFPIKVHVLDKGNLEVLGLLHQLCSSCLYNF